MFVHEIIMRIIKNNSIIFFFIVINCYFYFIFCVAQITQWDLIFHGTETPAQPNDPVDFGIDSAISMDQNSLDFDRPTANGQWRNMQHVNNSGIFYLKKKKNENRNYNYLCYFSLGISGWRKSCRCTTNSIIKRSN